MPKLRIKATKTSLYKLVASIIERNPEYKPLPIMKRVQYYGERCYHPKTRSLCWMDEYEVYEANLTNYSCEGPRLIITRRLIGDMETTYNKYCPTINELRALGMVKEYGGDLPDEA